MLILLDRPFATGEFDTRVSAYTHALVTSMHIGFDVKGIAVDAVFGFLDADGAFQVGVRPAVRLTLQQVIRSQRRLDQKQDLSRAERLEARKARREAASKEEVAPREKLFDQIVSDPGFQAWLEATLESLQAGHDRMSGRPHHG